MSSTAVVGPEKTGLLNWLDSNFEKPFLFVGMLLIIILSTTQVLYRYFGVKMGFDPTATAWMDEVTRFVFVWISYLAIPLAIKNRSNIRVDLIYDRLPPRFQGISWIVVDICFLALTILMAYNGYETILKQLARPGYSDILRIPYYLTYLVLPIAFGLMTVRLCQDIYKQFRESGLIDSIIGIVFCVIIAAPLLLGVEMNVLALLFGYFAVFLVLGVPIAIALGLASMVTIWGAEPMSFLGATKIAFFSIDKSTILAIPFFIAAGVFMGFGGLSKRLLDLADELLGSLYGGMALATIATCMFFAAISGSGPATVAAIGSLTIPAMIKRGYDKYFSCAIVACAGAIGVMIPPSNPFVVYGVSANASIGNLFIAGIVPGVLTGLVLMAYSYVISRKNGWKGEEKERNMKTFGTAIWNAKLALMVPVIVLGGIYGGFMTPTEAAAVSAFYGLFVGVFIYREINTKNIVPAIIESCATSAIVIVLMAMASIFGEIMTMEDVPGMIANFILSLTTNKIVILLLINVLLLIVGTFMEALAAIVILTPILLPIVTSPGIDVDPIHFGIIMVMNLAIGFVTPPVGVNLFVASGVAKVKIANLSKTVMPLLFLMICVLLCVTYIPSISLCLVPSN